MSNDKKALIGEKCAVWTKEHNCEKMYIWISIIFDWLDGFSKLKNWQSKNLKYKLVNENLLACEGEHFCNY